MCNLDFAATALTPELVEEGVTGQHDLEIAEDKEFKKIILKKSIDPSTELLRFRAFKDHHYLAR